MARVEALAAADIPTSALALSRCITTARSVADEIDAAQFDIITAAIALPAAGALGDELRAAVMADEFVTSLAPELHRVQREAVRLLSKPIVVVPPIEPVEPVVVPDPPPSPPEAKQRTAQSVADARKELDQLEARISDGGVDETTIQVHIAWVESAPPPDHEGGGG